MTAEKTMKNALWMAVAALMLAGPMGAYAQQAPAEPGDNAQPQPTEGAKPVAIKALVNSSQGNCFYRASEDGPWQPVKDGVELGVGGQIKTGFRGSVSLALGPNADVTIKPLTIMTIGQLEQDGDTLRTLLAMPRGKFDFHVKKIGFKNDFKVATPTGTMAVKGTEGTCSSFDGTEIDGNSNNGDNSIEFGNNNGKQADLSGNQQYDGGEVVVNATGPGAPGGGDGGPGGDDNSNNGDGNGNGGNPAAGTESLRGNDSSMNGQMEFEQGVQLPPSGGDG